MDNELKEVLGFGLGCITLVLIALTGFLGVIAGFVYLIVRILS